MDAAPVSSAAMLSLARRVYVSHFKRLRQCVIDNYVIKTYQAGGQLSGDWKELRLVLVDHGLHATVQNVQVGLFRKLEQGCGEKT